MTAFTQGYPLWLVDGEEIRLIVGWEDTGEDSYLPITVSLGGPGCSAQADLDSTLPIYPTQEMAQRAVERARG